MNLTFSLPWDHKEWNVVDGGLLPAVVGVMRFCWIWPWMLLLQGFLAPSLSAPLMYPWMVILLPILSFTFARWSMPTLAERRDYRRTNQIRQQIATFGFAAILFLVWLRFQRPEFWLVDPRWLLAAGYDLIYWDAIPIEVPGTFLFLLLGVFLWLRGALDGHGQYRHDEIWRAFLSGGAALALFAWIVPPVPAIGQSEAAATPLMSAGGQLSNSIWLIILFAASGLAGMGIANLGKSGGWRRRARVARLRPNRGWMAGIGLTIFVMLGVALLMALIIQPEDAAILWKALGLIWQGVSQVLIWIITVIAYPIFLILEYLIRLFRSLFGDRSQETERAEIAQPPAPEPMPELPERAVEGMPEPFRWIALIVVAAGVFFIFMLVLRQLRSNPEEESDEIRESVLTASLLQSQLADLWARLRSRFGPPPEEPDPYLSLEGEVDTRRLIRLIYQRLLEAAQMHNVPRLQSETPSRFGGRLAGKPRFDEGLVQTITDAYGEARYGDEPPSEQTAAEADKAWRAMVSDLTPDQPHKES
ncbi:MAG: DUF4129 domain-containing protein [Caldilineaceae bacterium]|nr:DUF4129 domain-containing protein [Caldilineaceae bacterium]MDE0340049.1 DUF4129 domain-containing protein [Caldilineaceae bacterium]